MPALLGCLYELASLYRVTLTPPEVALYWHSLQTYAPKQLSEAILRYLTCPKRGRFFPKPADLLALLNEDSAIVAKNAWENVKAAIQSVGSYNNIVFDDPYITGVIQELGGWVRLCQARRDDWAKIEKQFLVAYEVSAKKPAAQATPLRGFMHDLNYNPPIHWKTETLVSLISSNPPVVQHSVHDVPLIRAEVL